MVKSACEVEAEAITTQSQRPKWRFSSMLWSTEGITSHNRSHRQPLHPGLAPDILTLSYLWIQLGQDEGGHPNYNPINSACHLYQPHKKPCGHGRSATQ